MKKVVVMIMCCLAASVRASDLMNSLIKNEAPSSADLFKNIKVPSPNKTLNSEELKKQIVEEQYLFYQLKGQAKKYAKEHYTRIPVNEKQMNEKQKEKLLENADTTSEVVEKVLGAMELYMNNVESKQDALKTDLQNIAIKLKLPGSQLDIVSKKLGQVHSAQKKPRWNYAAIIGNLMQLGLYGLFIYFNAGGSKK